MSVERIRVVHIISTSYSGSTWFNLLLGAHARAMSVGELKSIGKVGAAVCTIHGQRCSVWPHIAVDPSAENTYEQLRARTGCDVFIVNNSRKYLWAQQAPGIDQKFIHLVRDGRAVVASHMRKFKDISAWAASRNWRRSVQRNVRLMRRQPPEDVFEVLYERVKGDPAGELLRLCAFIGIDYDASMIEFWKADQHFLGGNRSTLFSLMKATGRELPENPDRRAACANVNWDFQHYQDKDIQHFTDERWRHELSEAQLRPFRWIAGRLNRKLGYQT